MATGHQLSAITNSCVKMPLNPQSGLAATLDERNQSTYSGTWHGNEDRSKDMLGNGLQNDGSGGHLFFNKTVSMLQDTADMGDLTDEEFYKRLLELKSDHKKTLQMCEQLYAEKVGTDYFTRSLPNKDLYEDYELDDQQPVNKQQHVFDTSGEHLKGTYDGIKDMSPKRPPTGKPPISAGRPTKSLEGVSRSGGRQAWASHSEADYWKMNSVYSTDADSSYTGVKTSGHRGRSAKHEDTNISKSSGVSRIEDMWENFSIEDYAPRTRPRSSSLSRMSTSSKKDTSSEWRHRITIPKPFNLTESKSERNKSKTLQEFQREREEKERREDYECQKQFKATPVPAHVYMPLYEEIIEKQEAQRRMNKETGEMLLKSQEKPFKFMRREIEKKKYRTRDHPCKCDKEDHTVKKKDFKATPFPVDIFDNTVDDQMMEEEEYRRIRMQMRSEELLRASSLPPNMRARGEEYVLGKSRVKANAVKAKKSGINTDYKFKPKINNSIPDFDELHRNFHNELNHRKNVKESTVCKPFNLRTSTTVKRSHKVYDDVLDDESMLKENRWQFRTPKKNFSSSLTRSLSSSMDSLPTKMTASSQMRASATKSKMQKQMDNELAELESRRRRRQRERALQKQVSERAVANDCSIDLRTSQRDKLRQYREAEQTRREEYRQQLSEIEERVGQRPLLFERTAQENAQKAADKKYLETLRRAGLDEEFVSKKGSRASSMHDYQDDDKYDAVSDDDNSYNYSSVHTGTRSATRSRSASHTRSQTRSRSASRYDSDGSFVKTDEDVSDVDAD